MANNRIIFITGRKGSGKSTFAANLSLTAYRLGHRVVILDPMACLELPGAPVLSSAAEILNVEAGRSFVFRPPTDAESGRFLIYARNLRRTLVVVDEADLYAPTTFGEGNQLLEIVRYGRHPDLSLIAVSQRPANVARDLTAQSDYIVAFHTTEPRDVLYLAQRIGQAKAQELTTLPLFTPRVYSAMTGGWIEPGRFESEYRQFISSNL